MCPRHIDPRRKGTLGAVLAVLVLGELVLVGVTSALQPAPAEPLAAARPGLVENVATALFTNYLIPFEVASMLLLVAMVGAIVLAKKEL